MSNIDIIRAWKDQDYRNSLTSAELASIPANPVGLIELTDEDLGRASGGSGPFASMATLRCCTMLTGGCDTPCSWPSCQ